MPLIPDYQSAVDSRVERSRKATSGSDWLTTLAFLACGGIALKALLVSDAVHWDEKTTVVLMLVVATGLLTWSLALNLRRREVAGIDTNVLSVCLLVAAFFLTARGWR